MVKVYFESIKHWHSEHVATFESEELYMACLPALEAEAKEIGMVVTERITEEEYSYVYTTELQPQRERL